MDKLNKVGELHKKNPNIKKEDDMLNDIMDKLIHVDEMYKKDPNIKKEDVQKIMEWCVKQPHLPKVLELQVVLALHCTYYRIEAAKSVLDRHFTIRAATPGLFANTNPHKNEVLKNNLNIILVAPIPKVLTPKGNMMILCKLLDYDPTLFDTMTGGKLADMIVYHYCGTTEPPNGICVVIDTKGATLAHLARTNISLLRKFAIYAETGIPIRITHIHFINVVPFMDKVLGIIKPFLGKEFFDKILCHTKNEDVYKCVPKEMFPVDYGGKADSVKVLHERYVKTVYENQWLFDFLQTQTVDESQRTGPNKNSNDIFGFEGNFKKIVID